MRLKVLLPTEILLETEVSKIVAEAEDGYFCLLPRHVDFVAALAPGLLAYVPAGRTEEYLAVDEGVLVKRGPEVLVSARRAARGSDLSSLRQTVEAQYQELDERERTTRAVLAKLEADLVRRFVELGRD